MRTTQRSCRAVRSPHHTSRFYPRLTLYPVPSLLVVVPNTYSWKITSHQQTAESERLQDHGGSGCHSACSAVRQQADQGQPLQGAPRRRHPRLACHDPRCLLSHLLIQSLSVRTLWFWSWLARSTIAKHVLPSIVLCISDMMTVQGHPHLGLLNGVRRKHIALGDLCGWLMRVSSETCGRRACWLCQWRVSFGDLDTHVDCAA